MQLRRLLPAVLAAALALGPVSGVAALGEYTSVTLVLTAPSSVKVATTESKRFNLLPGGARWFAGPTVEYQIVGAPFPAAVGAVETSEATIDAYVTTRELVHNDATTQLNPCTGQPNVVRWARLDGSGGLVGSTSLCLIKKQIVGFTITLDSQDGWAIGNDGNPATYDVQSVVTHELGHVAGLEHVVKPTDACLTMYLTTGPESTENRTLGLGDKLGLDKLYKTGDTSPGPGCGL